MRLAGPALLLILLAPLAAAQTAARLDVSLSGLPESLGTMRSGETQDAEFNVTLRLDGIVCPADAQLPVQLSVDDHTQAPFLRVAVDPQQLVLQVPAGAYPGSTAGNDASYHATAPARMRVFTGGVTADTSFLIEVTAAASGVPDGCKATADVPPAKSAPMATRLEVAAPARLAAPEASPTPTPATTPPREAPAPGLGALLVATALLGSLMRRAKP